MAKGPSSINHTTKTLQLIKGGGWRRKAMKWKTSSEVKNNNNNQNHKSLLEVLPSKYHHWEFCWINFWLKKMITEVLLILPLYLILFTFWWWFRPLIKAMTDVWDILNDDDYLRDTVDTPKEGIEQHKKRKESHRQRQIRA